MAFYTALEIQEMLQIDRSTVYRMAEGGKIPAIKVGRQWRFPQDQIKSWLAAQVVSGAKAVSIRTASASAPLAEMLSRQCVQLIQDNFADLLGVMMVITDLDGRPITDISNPPPFFTRLSRYPQVMDKCLEHWRGMATAIDIEPRYERSHLGMLCARGLIRVGNELKGMLFLGGLADESWPPTDEESNRLAEDLDISQQEFKSAISDVHFLDDAGRKKTLEMIQRVANIISHIASERDEMLGKLDAIARLTALK